MNELIVAMGIAVMFLLRVGVPVLILITIGIIIDRWQSKRERDFTS